MKKAFSLALSAVLSASMLVGCGGSSTATASTAAASTATPKASAAATTAVASGDEIPVNEAAAADPKITLTMAEVNPIEGTIVGQTDQKFKDEVERISGGSITIDLQASGVLGSENDVLDSMLADQGQTINISRISAFALTSYGTSKSKLLSIPYTFENRDHYWNFVNSDLSQEFLDEPEELGLGIRGIFFGEEGFRHFFTKNSCTSIDDLKGMKLRVSNDPIMTGMVTALGASPTVVSFNELYSALQTGVVDGAEQPIANYESNAFPEVAPYLILDGHTLGAIEVVIGDYAWNKLTANQQQVLVDAGKAAEAYDKEVSQSSEDEVLAKLKTEGVTVTEVTDKTPWKEACKDVISENTSDQADLYQKILDLAD
ncbi:MAG: TRAP transporter substrate-binding protein [Solobacterium sp.]|nr:TRAP transporter substrate-binding protein [Solobacterium sp.]MCH4223340.1 TRAP transporter substrate-binding protein [Solobacterium sp.]MCH4266675.1 TRAP transporter substrate-binding protein [Solobacterium sp.]